MYKRNFMLRPLPRYTGLELSLLTSLLQIPLGMECQKLLLSLVSRYEEDPDSLRRLCRKVNEEGTMFRRSLDCKDLLQRTLSTSRANSQTLVHIARSTKSFGIDTQRESCSALLYQFAFEEVGHYWKELGATLGFEKRELDNVEEWHLNHQQGVKFMAWTMLERYQAKTPNFKRYSLKVIQKKLDRVKERREADVCVKVKKAKDLLPFGIVNDRRFYGRERELEQVADFLWKGKRKTSEDEPIMSQEIQIISGVGGLGKSSLAFQYLFRYAESYSDGVFYFIAESFWSLLESLKESISRVPQLQIEPLPTIHTFKKVRQHFWNYCKNHSRSLLLFDNADDFDVVKDWFPDPIVPCHVVVTTRRTQKHDIFYQRNVSLLTLDVLQNESATLALCRWAGKSEKDFDALDLMERKHAHLLANEAPIEGLPVAIAHAGSFIDQHRISFRQYWDKIQSESKQLDAAALKLDDFLRYFYLSHLKELLQCHNVHRIDQLLKIDPRTIDERVYNRKLLENAQAALKTEQRAFLTWKMDIDDVESTSAYAYQLLMYSSVMSPRSISLNVVAGAVFSEVAPVHRDFKVAGALRTLNERSLIQKITEPDNDFDVSFSMHHLIQSSMLQRLGENVEDLHRVLKSVAKELMNRLPSLSDIEKNLLDPALSSLFSHVYSVVEKMLEAGLLDETCPGLSDFACSLALCFNEEIAERLSALRVAALDASAGLFSVEETRKRKRQYYLTWAASSHIMQIEKIEATIKKALGGKEYDALTDEEILYYECELITLAKVYIRRDQLDIAEKMLLRLTEVLRHLPAEVPSILTVNSMLTEINSKAKNYNQAIVMVNMCLSLARNSPFGSDLLSASCHQEMARLCMCSGQSREALENFEKAEKLYRTALPPSHEILGEFLVFMSGCDRLSSARACELSREGLAILKSTCSPTHPRLSYALYYHGTNLVSHHQRQDDETIKCFEDCLALLDADPQEPNAMLIKANCLTALGVALRKDLRQRYTEQKQKRAVKYFQQAIKFFTILNPEGSILMTAALYDLSKLYADSGEVSKAARLMDQAWHFAQRLPIKNSLKMEVCKWYVKTLIASNQSAKAVSVAEHAKEKCKHLYSDQPSFQLMQEILLLLKLL